MSEKEENLFVFEQQTREETTCSSEVAGQKWKEHIASEQDQQKSLFELNCGQELEKDGQCQEKEEEVEQQDRGVMEGKGDWEGKPDELPEEEEADFEEEEDECQQVIEHELKQLLQGVEEDDQRDAQVEYQEVVQQVEVVRRKKKSEVKQAN